MLIHGLAESHRAWNRLVPLLPGSMRVVRVDLFGFGDSPEPPGGYSIAEQGLAVAEVLRSAGVSAAMLVGHSLGGSVAVALAESARELVQSLVLINAPPSTASRTLSPAERALRTPGLGAAAWATMGDRARRIGLRSAFAPRAEVPQEFVEDLGRTSYAAFTGSSTGLEAYLDERPLALRVAELGIRTTVIFGIQDQRVDPASLEPFAGLSNVRVERLPDSGHSPMWEQPELVAELLCGPGLRRES